MTKKEHDLFRKKWLELAAEMLDKAADKFGNHICNDWEFPKGWTRREKLEFNRALRDEFAGDYEEWGPVTTEGDADWLVMQFLAGRLKKLAALQKD